MTVEMDKEHPYFNPHLELLCSLGPTPVPLRSLCKDHGIPNNDRLCAALDELRQRNAIRITVGHAKVVGSANRRQCAWIEPADWPKADRIATDYWDRVYGTAATA